MVECVCNLGGKRSGERWAGALGYDSYCLLLACIPLPDGLASVMTNQYILDSKGTIQCRADKTEEAMRERRAILARASATLNLFSLPSEKEEVLAPVYEIKKTLEKRWQVQVSFHFPNPCPSEFIAEKVIYSAWKYFLESTKFLESVSAIHHILRYYKRTINAAPLVKFETQNGLDLSSVEDIYKTYKEDQVNYYGEFTRSLKYAYFNLRDKQFNNEYIPYSALRQIGRKATGQGDFSEAYLKALCDRLGIDNFAAAKSLFLLRERCLLRNAFIHAHRRYTRRDLLRKETSDMHDDGLECGSSHLTQRIESLLRLHRKRSTTDSAAATNDYSGSREYKDVYEPSSNIPSSILPFTALSSALSERTERAVVRSALSERTERAVVRSALSERTERAVVRSALSERTEPCAFWMPSS